MEPRMFVQPGHHVGMLASSVVVQDYVNLLAPGDLSIDHLQEGDELPVAVAGIAPPDQFPGEYIESGNKVVVP